MLTSYNDWPASSSPDLIDIDESFTAAGVSFPGGVKAGAVARVFRDLAEQYHSRVEPLRQGWCWGYEFRPNTNDPSSLSCHASGTALDLNAPLHPNGQAGTLDDHQRRAVKQLLRRYDGVLSWGGEFYGTVDEMHWEISAEPADVERLAVKLDVLENAVTPPKAEDMPLSQEDIDAVAKAVMGQLRTARVVRALYIDTDTGEETGADVSIVRALGNAQTQSSRAAYWSHHE